MNGLLLVALLCGCSDGPRAGAPDELPVMSLVEDLRIDGHEADLVPVTWLGVSREGRIAVLQLQDHAVRFFDASGRDLGAVGREGEGPGEFRRPIRAGWVGDSLWVSDPSLGRAVVISPELSVARTTQYHDVVRPLPPDTLGLGGYLRPSPYAMYEDGGSLNWAFRREEGSGAELDGSPLLRVTADGHIHHLVAVVPNTEGLAVTIGLPGGGIWTPSIPYAARPYWSVSPDGARFAHLSTDIISEPLPTYRVFVVDSAGAQVFDRAYPFEPEPIPAAQLDSAIEARASQGESLSAEAESKLRAAAPDIFPEAVRLFVGWDRRIWIGMRAASANRRWRILSEAGDPEAEVVVPRSVTLWAADEGFVWGSEEDELGVESIVRYRLEPPDSR